MSIVALLAHLVHEAIATLGERAVTVAACAVASGVALLRYLRRWETWMRGYPIIDSAISTAVISTAVAAAAVVDVAVVDVAVVTHLRAFTGSIAAGRALRVAGRRATGSPHAEGFSGTTVTVFYADPSWRTDHAVRANRGSRIVARA